MSAPPRRAIPLGRVVLVVFATAFVLLAIFASGSYSLPRTDRAAGNGGVYVTRTVNLSPPASAGSTSGPVTEVAVGPTSFSLRLIDWFSAAGPAVNGSVAEWAGPILGFTVGGPPTTTGWANWTSPDGTSGVDYNEDVTVLIWTVVPHPAATP
ncbi:MAG TPA: hypothetical protein VGU43_02460 [Thermoplasmata archaeon]|nr:hypothetical protein [Thermoplasmata archaeon]